MRTADERRFESFLAEFSPENAALGRGAVSWLRKRLPTADVMIYDNYNFLVAGFSPNDRPSDVVLSIAMSARGVALCFLQGATLPDPQRILRGSGRLVRNLRLASVNDFERPEVQMLLEIALDQARVPFDSNRTGRLYVRSVSRKKRPRQKEPR